MFIFLSKVLPPLVLPVGLCLLGLLLGLLLLARRRARLGGALVLLSTALLWGAATPLCADRLLGSLEDQHPLAAAEGMPMADAIIILGGGTTGRAPDQPQVELGQSGGRLMYGFRLYRAGKAPLILLSGGEIDPSRQSDTEAEQMRQILGEWGVPERALVLETRSRNTRENAVESMAIARQRGLRRILLVTSAFHMPRALLLLRKEAGDTEIIPAPTGRYISGRRPFAALSYLPDAGALVHSTLALRERMGLVVYRLRGWL